MTVRELIAELVKHNLDYEAKVVYSGFKTPLEILQVEVDEERSPGVVTLEIDIHADDLHPDILLG